MGEKRTTDEINDANESLKLLRLKMGSKGTNGILNSNATNGNNDNYRKPFNPNAGDLDRNLININSNKNTFDINALNTKKTESNFGNVSTRNNNNVGRVRKNQVEEIKDDRPAFNEKGEDIYE